MPRLFSGKAGPIWLAMTLLRPPGYGGQAIFFGTLHSVVRVWKGKSNPQVGLGAIDQPGVSC